MMNWEYLIFNLIIFLSPIVGVKLYKSAVLPKLKPYFFAALLVSTPYIVWDQIVAGAWWSFNPLYVSGIFIGRLPVEEVLFFFTIPFATLVLWVNIKKIFPDKILKVNYGNVFLLAGLSISLYGIFIERYYTFAVGLLFVLFVFVAKRYSKLLSSALYIKFLGAVTLLITVFNGYLTARPVVVYSNDFISGIKVITIPVEDYIYGLVLVGLVVVFYEYFASKKIN